MRTLPTRIRPFPILGLLLAVQPLSGQAVPLGQVIQGRTFEQVHELDEVVAEWFIANVRGARKVVVVPAVQGVEGRVTELDGPSRGVTLRALVARRAGALTLAEGTDQDCHGRPQDVCMTAGDVVLVPRQVRPRGQASQYSVGYVIFTKYEDRIHLVTVYVNFDSTPSGVTVTGVMMAVR